MAEKVIVIGGGPAGLTAAYELLKDKDNKYDVTLLEESYWFGGISKTVEHNGNRMDIGGHRLFSKNEQVNEIWKELINMFNNLINGTKILYSYCWMYEIMNLASSKFNIQNIDNKDLKINIENIFTILTNKLMDAVFSEKFDSKYFNQNQLVLPFLPHIYTNIVNLLYEEDNLYKKNVEGSSNIKDKANKNENIERIENKNDLASLLDDNTIDSEIFDKKATTKRSKTISNNMQFHFSNTLVKKIDGESSRINVFYKIYIDYARTSSEYNKDKMKNKII